MRQESIPWRTNARTIAVCQREAIELGAGGTDFVVTSGTGSGKSLTYIATIFNHLLTSPGDLA